MDTSFSALRDSVSPNSGSRRLPGKRKRKTLSCFECRRRKLKCDREQPACSRCRKANQSELCSYVYDASLSSVSHPSRQSPDLEPSSEPHNARSKHVALDASHRDHPSPPQVASQFLYISGEELTPSSSQPTRSQGTWSLLGHFPSTTNDVRGTQSNTVHDKRPGGGPLDSFSNDSVIFRGEDYATQYYGASNPTSLIAHFPELRYFVKETIQSQSGLPRVQRELKALQARWKSMKADDIPLLTHEELLQLLPDEQVTSQHVRLYFETVETTYRILHYQTFHEQYRLMWQNPKQVDSAIVIIVLMIMASVGVIFSQDDPKYIGDSSMSREKATMWIRISEIWVSRQSRKHISLSIWQIRCMIVYAKQMNVVKKKRIWTEAGTLVREAMSAGFHRDPSGLGDRASLFDQEMRRRLWATITELELQISIDRGMPCASASIPSDMGAVVNADDAELANNCRPTSKPLHLFTSASFLHISKFSFSLRVTLNTKINDPSSPLDHETVLSYDDIIAKELQRLHETFSQTVSGDNKARKLVHYLLDIQLRQFLIMLHAPFARKLQTKSRFALSRIASLTAATRIIDMYTDLMADGDYSLLLLRNDYYRGALAICQNIYNNSIIKSNPCSGFNDSTLIRCLQDSLLLLEQRITQHGTGYTHYWYISAAIAFVRCILVPSTTKMNKEEAINSVTQQYRRILDSQEELNIAKIILTSVRSENNPPQHCSIGNMETTVDNNNSNGFFTSQMPDAQGMTMDFPLDEFFFGNPAAWTFENLWNID